MKLNEKVYACRKEAGMSQETLAEMLGVSRQAVSKWETGEAEPEIRKLQQLAKVFHVTTDWLLSEEEEAAAPPPPQSKATPLPTSWIDDLPKSLGRFLRRYGWLAGVYLMVGGLLLMLMGGAAFGISSAMVKDFQESYEDMFNGGIVDAWGELDDIENIPGLDDIQTSMGVSKPTITVSNPVAMVGIVIMCVGGLVTVVGAMVAIVLWRNGRKQSGKL